MLLLQVAAKLQLVSSFVAAHSIGQQVFEAHLTGRPPASTNGKSHLAAPSHNNPNKDQARAGFGAVDADDSDADVAQQVLRESRAEADAALQYAHEVRRAWGGWSRTLAVKAASAVWVCC